jgi:hypothetical protein
MKSSVPEIDEHPCHITKVLHDHHPSCECCFNVFLFQIAFDNFFKGLEKSDLVLFRSNREW